ncbi:MAG: redox-regulated ATPase YchF [Deltaproteobacteria bacterium]|nr:redox-regulated ATPase YchF [Deltaproteobacteria bacterium]
MGLSIGIVGLPNVGKSTLFNALSGAQVLAANYPFATKDPNVGIVPVPDARLAKLAKLSASKKIIPAALEFVDIAGLVRGASKGEGLGNQFLANIREVDAIAHVLRCFKDGDVVHVEAGGVDPERDKDVVDTELALKDLETLEKKRDRRVKESKAAGKAGEEAKADVLVYDKLKVALDAGKPARSVKLTDEELPRARELFLLTAKPVLYVANVDEEQLGKIGENGENAKADPMVAKVAAIAEREGAKFVAICSKVEAEIQQLPEGERADYLGSLGLSEPGLHKLVRKGFDLLGLQAYFTTGPEETRAWVIKRGFKAPQAAGVIHTDFERGFIKAETIQWNVLLDLGGEVAAKQKGALRVEGKEYVVQDGDVMHFMFNV